MRKPTILSLVFVATLAVAGVYASSSGTAVTREESTPAYASAPPPPYRALPDSARAALSSDVRVSLSEMKSSEAAESRAPRIDRDIAAEIVRANLGLGASGEAVSASLQTVTTHEYGRQLESDRSKPSRIAPALDGVEVWVIAFRDVPLPVLGKTGDATTARRAGELTRVAQDLVAFVDPESGALLYAVSY